VNVSGTVTNAVRSYSFDGELIATRTPSGPDYVVTDEQGSVAMSMPGGGGRASYPGLAVVVASVVVAGGGCVLGALRGTPTAGMGALPGGRNGNDETP